MINLILVVITAAIWISFAPLKIGGLASYVMVHGNSMEPGFHSGDLAITKANSDYNVGEIITYYNSQMGAHIIHRIIGVERGHYILKGDNNSWIDAYRPTQEEILGKLWIRAPKLGLIVQWLRLPINMALIAGILGGVLMVGQNTQPNQHGKRKNKPSGGSSTGWFEITLWQAVVMEAGLLVFFMVYTFVFNWCFDRIFGLPASAQAQPVAAS